MKSSARSDADRVWQQLVSLVMETRGDWRRKVIEATGLPFSRARVLWRLEEAARSLSELAHDMGIDAPAATVIVNDLEQRGLVERRPQPHDRRTKLVSLTTAGRRQLVIVNKISDKPPAALAELSSTQLALLSRALEASAKKA